MLMFSLLIMLCCFVFMLLNAKYKKTVAHKNRSIVTAKYLQGVPSEIEIAIFGSTYAKFAFDSIEDLPCNAFNFALDCESLEFDFSLLQHYAQHLKKGCKVIVSVAACVMFYRFEEAREIHYQVLPESKLPKRNIKAKLKMWLPLLFYPQRVLFAFFDEKINRSIYDVNPQFSTAEESRNNMKDLVECWKRMFSLPDFINTNFGQKNIENIQYNMTVLSKVFDFCAEKNFVPIVVVPPFSEELNQYFSDDFSSVIMQYVQGAIGERDIPIYNFRSDKSFQAKELYVDGGFRLNNKGSIAFVRQMFQNADKN